MLHPLSSMLTVSNVGHQWPMWANNGWHWPIWSILNAAIAGQHCLSAAISLFKYRTEHTVHMLANVADVGYQRWTLSNVSLLAAVKMILYTCLWDYLNCKTEIHNETRITQGTRKKIFWLNRRKPTFDSSVLLLPDYLHLSIAIAVKLSFRASLIPNWLWVNYVTSISHLCPLQLKLSYATLLFWLSLCWVMSHLLTLREIYCSDYYTVFQSSLWIQQLSIDTVYLYFSSDVTVHFVSLHYFPYWCFSHAEANSSGEL